MVFCIVSCWVQLVSAFLRDVEFSQMVIYRLFSLFDGLERQMPKPVLMVRIHWHFNINAVRVFQNTKKYILGSHTRVLWSSFPLHWKPNILLVNYDSWWQHQMSVRKLRHDRPSGWFSKSRGLSASISFLSSPPPPSSFIGVILDSRSSFVAPEPHGNACYAGYIFFFSLNRDYSNSLTLSNASELFWSWISSSWREWILPLLVCVLHKTWN